jgi:hypothetical protein
MMPPPEIPTSRYLLWEYLQRQQHPMTTRQLKAAFPHFADLNSMLCLLLKGKHVTRARANKTNYYTYAATSLAPARARKNSVPPLEARKVMRVKVPLQSLITPTSLARAREFTSAPLVRQC